MKKLRLLITKDCLRDCEGCCNKDWDLENLPIIESYKDYSEILLTGGEPMINTLNLLQTINDIRKENKTAKIYVYTTESIIPLIILENIDGITLTIHKKEDIQGFLWFDNFVSTERYKYLSLRLNIFGNIPLAPDSYFPNWKIKRNMKWIKNCELPENEEFRRLNEI